MVYPIFAFVLNIHALKIENWTFISYIDLELCHMFFSGIFVCLMPWWIMIRPSDVLKFLKWPDNGALEHMEDRDPTCLSNAHNAQHPCPFCLLFRRAKRHIATSSFSEWWDAMFFTCIVLVHFWYNFVWLIWQKNIAHRFDVTKLSRHILWSIFLCFFW